MTVAVIIPAYDEAETVGSVVAVCRQVPEINEVIVVSDGSTDRTAEVARRAGASRVVELHQNHGKGAAMKIGVDHTPADVIMFIDADLVGLTTVHLSQLLMPVLHKQADMTLGLFEGGRFTSDFGQALAPFLSGQRALRRSLLDHVENMEDSGYGVEILLTQATRRLGATVLEVPLEQLGQRHKEEKVGLVRGFSQRLKMYWEIARSATKIQRR